VIIFIFQIEEPKTLQVLFGCGNLGLLKQIIKEIKGRFVTGNWIY
tara:strand:- start:4050 stop:4184 length:135 start_codon:yes stop_codon:yes gene_type:complete